MPLVEISNLKVAFDGVPVLHGIDLSIERGEAVGLVGESGCGKSVTWLAALGLLPKKASISGSVLLEGTELLTASRSTRRCSGWPYCDDLSGPIEFSKSGYSGRAPD